MRIHVDSDPNPQQWLKVHIGKVGDGEDDNTDERAKPGSEEGTEAESERV